MSEEANVETSAQSGLNRDLTEQEMEFINNAKKMTAKHTCKLLTEYILWLASKENFTEHKKELENIASKSSQISPYNYSAHLELETDESADTFCFVFEYGDKPYVQEMFLPDASYQQDAVEKIEMMFAMIAAFWAHLYSNNKNMFTRLETIIGEKVTLKPDPVNQFNLMLDSGFDGRVMFRIYIRRSNGDICIPMVTPAKK
ncbi:hypothetical protein F-liban_62 [Faustovirus]|nr:hypothetical protein F-liban_62 [Faustovirus]SME64734.1 Hypothetical protein FSTVST1_61 [Faustovirus ST1]